jgi:hypothetical protein
VLVQFRDWLFARIRGSGIRARSRARQAEWLRATPPRADGFVGELERLLKETSSNAAYDFGASDDKGPINRSEETSDRSTVLNGIEHRPSSRRRVRRGLATLAHKSPPGPSRAR